MRLTFEEAQVLPHDLRGRVRFPADVRADCQGPLQAWSGPPAASRELEADRQFQQARRGVGQGRRTARARGRAAPRSAPRPCPAGTGPPPRRTSVAPRTRGACGPPWPRPEPARRERSSTARPAPPPSNSASPGAPPIVTYAAVGLPFPGPSRESPYDGGAGTSAAKDGRAAWTAQEGQRRDATARVPIARGEIGAPRDLLRTVTRRRRALVGTPARGRRPGR